MTTTVANRQAVRPRAERRRRRAVMLVGGAAACALVAVRALGGDAGGTDLLAGADLPAAGSSVVSYTIAYETTYTDGQTLEERLSVERPFRSRITGGDSVQVSDAGVLATTSGGPWLRIEVPIGVASGDLHPLPVLDDAVAHGLIEPLAERTVNGRPCHAYRLGGPVASGAFTPVGTTPGEFADVCFDELGLVLSEEWTVDGELARTRTAVDLRVTELDDEAFTVPSDAMQLSFDDGGGAVAPVDPEADPGFVEYWRLHEVPDGFGFVDRWAVVPPALDAATGPAGNRARDIALVTDAWTDGADLLVLDQGAVDGGALPPWNLDAPGTDVDLGALGPGRLVRDLRMSEIRVLRPEGGFVRLAGTLAPDRLVDIARTLSLQPTGDPS